MNVVLVDPPTIVEARLIHAERDRHGLMMVAVAAATVAAGTVVPVAVIPIIAVIAATVAAGAAGGGTGRMRASTQERMSAPGACPTTRCAGSG